MLGNSENGGRRHSHEVSLNVDVLGPLNKRPVGLKNQLMKMNRKNETKFKEKQKRRAHIQIHGYAGSQATSHIDSRQNGKLRDRYIYRIHSDTTLT